MRRQWQYGSPNWPTPLPLSRPCTTSIIRHDPILANIPQSSFGIHMPLVGNSRLHLFSHLFPSRLGPHPMTLQHPSSSPIRKIRTFSAGMPSVYKISYPCPRIHKSATTAKSPRYCGRDLRPNITLGAAYTPSCLLGGHLLPLRL